MEPSETSTETSEIICSRVVYSIADCIKSNYKRYDCTSPSLVSYQDVKIILESCRTLLMQQAAFPILSPPIMVIFISTLPNLGTLVPTYVQSLIILK